MATSRRRKTAILLAISTFAISHSTLLGQGPDPVESPPPNVLMIAIDDLRPMLGCYGDPIVKTPNIDALAARGMLFERAYCQFSKCGPSRLSILNGLRPDSVGVFSHRDADMLAFREKNPDLPSLPRWFKQHGYHTRSFGKVYHDGWDDPRDWSDPAEPGREKEMLEIVDEKAIEGVPFEDRAKVPTVIAERLECPVMQSPDVPDETLFAGRMTNRVIGLLKERKGEGAPFFYAVGYRRPHLPFVAPRKWYDLYEPDPSWLPPAEWRRPPVDAPLMAWFNSDGYVGSARNQGLKMPQLPKNEEIGMAWAGYEMRSYVGIPNRGTISDETQIAVRRAYRACISYVDGQIGRLLAELESAGLARNTIVLLWSDHGWHLGEQGAWSKMTNYEIATRVPLIIAAPGEAYVAGKTKSLAELVDLYPTLCDLASLPHPEHLEGSSLAPVLKDANASVKSVAGSQYPRFRDRYDGRAWTDGRYRWVDWTDTKSGELAARELYDHETDPGETLNLANRPESAEILKSLEAKK
ncbi:MAG: sulfatase [Verrucomicrobiae bacterium]|nr:sulfatase [Verrucomicrobiae bacterium]